MKKLSVIVLLFAAAACSSKKTPSGSNDNPNAIIVSMKGIGDFKIGMKRESVEKLLKHKLELPHLSVDTINGYLDSAKCKYKDIDYTLTFMKEWQEDSSFITKLSMISCSSPLLKTPSGIGMGDDLCKIAGAYEDHRLNIMPTYDYNSNTPTRIKGKSMITLFDTESENAITFYMNNNKVEAMDVAFYEGD